jgi:shikimate kinase
MMDELLTPDELTEHVRAGTFRLAFIGMSNAGKTYRSNVLRSELDFAWYHVDGAIGAVLGFSDIKEISDWMGLPSSPDYTKREQEYLALENKYTRQSAMNTDGKNLVFDTTGSVVHLEPETLSILHQNCLMVHLDVGDDSLEPLIKKFFAHPKPVAWCGHFATTPSETETSALKRCYPKLLAWRLAQYRELAHISVPAKEVYDTSAEETLACIASYLRDAY